MYYSCINNILERVDVPLINLKLFTVHFFLHLQNMRLKNRPYTHLQVRISTTAKDAFPFLYRVGILKPFPLQHYIQTHLTNAERTRVQPVVFAFRAPCTRFLSTSKGEKTSTIATGFLYLRGRVSLFERLFKLLPCIKKTTLAYILLSFAVQINSCKKTKRIYLPKLHMDDNILGS